MIDFDTLTLSSIRRLLIKLFIEYGVESAQLDADLLLQHACDKNRLELMVCETDEKLEAEAIERLKCYVKRRLNKEPIAYIIGYRYFWNACFRIDQRALIPRPETELLIECLLKFYDQNAPLFFLELGVGSGALISSLLSEFKNSHAIGTDISHSALDLALQNLQKQGVSDRCCLVQSDWFQAIQKGQKFDIIISNPPYIKTREIARLQKEILCYEPRIALDGGENGLDPYKILADHAFYFLNPGGRLLMETGSGQTKSIKALINRHACWKEVSVYQDLNGHDRVVSVLYQVE